MNTDIIVPLKLQFFGLITVNPDWLVRIASSVFVIAEPALDYISVDSPYPTRLALHILAVVAGAYRVLSQMKNETVPCK